MRNFFILILLMTFLQVTFAQEMIKKNDVINLILEDYIEKLLNEKDSTTVIRIDYKNLENETEIFTLSQIICTNDIKYKPLIFFDYKDYYVLFYSGIETHYNESLLLNNNQNYDKMLKRLFVQPNPKDYNKENYYEFISKSLIIDGYFVFRYTVKNGSLEKVEKIVDYNYDPKLIKKGNLIKTIK